MPARLTRISRRAFKGCSSLKSVILPSTVRYIGFDAFAGCSSLSHISIPRGVAELEDGEVFSACDSLGEISYGGSQAEWEMLNRGKTLTIERSDCTVSVPRVNFIENNEI